MKSGFVPKEKAPDELIAGTERGGSTSGRSGLAESSTAV
jgi:hypothetical protein